MAYQETVLVKHSVTGRAILNNKEQPFDYNLEQYGETGWKISLFGISLAAAQAVIALKDELNVFRFEEPNDGPVIKHWYYVNDGNVNYNESERCLTIYAASEIRYLPSEYLS